METVRSSALTDEHDSTPAGPAHQRPRRAWLDYLVAAALLLVFLKNYWVSEDAYLNFRSVDQLLRGHGPIWNPHERVQVFTSPLWYWLHAICQLIVRHGYLAVLLLSTACFGLSTLLLRKIVGSSESFALAGLLLVGSNAYFDYTSSGQENVLGYVLVLYYLRAYLELVETQSAPQARRPLCHMFAAAGLLVVCRHDLLTLFAPSLAYACWSRRDAFSARGWFALGAAASAPLLAWSAFSLAYYGSVLPNTAYAKLSTGFPRGVFIERGLDYIVVLARYDTLSALAIAAAGVALLMQGTSASRFLAASLGTHIAYVVYVGGDYMQGRFLSYDALISIALLSRFAAARAVSSRWVPAAVATALTVYAVANPRTPLNTTWAQPKDESAIHAPGRRFVMDARGTLGAYTSLYSYLQADDSTNFPQHKLAIAGRQFAKSDQTVGVIHAAGMFGWSAGTDKIVIEAHGIADSLLARLPASAFGGVGHYVRYRPEGYVDGLIKGKVVLEDADLNTYYSKLMLITQSPQLFTWERLETIAQFNLGHYEPLLEHFVHAKIRGQQVLPGDARVATER